MGSVDVGYECGVLQGVGSSSEGLVDEVGEDGGDEMEINVFECCVVGGFTSGTGVGWR